jgi:hypothetical protein
MRTIIKRHATFLTAAAALATALISLTGCAPKDKSGEIYQVLRRIPDDAALVIAAKPAAIFSSQFFKAFPDIEPKLGEFSKGRAECRAKIGLDPLADIDRVILYNNDLKESFEKNWAVILEGRFERFFLDSLTTKSDLIDSLCRMENFQVHCLWEPKSEDKEKLYLYFEKNEMLLTIHEPNMIQLLQLKKGGMGRTLADRKELVSRILSLKFHDHLWFMIPTEGLMKDVLVKVRKKRPDFQADLLEITSIQGGLKLDGELGIDLQADCSSEKPAKLLFDTANGFLALGKLSAGVVPELRTILDRVEIVQKAKTLEITLSLPAKDIRNLKNLDKSTSILIDRLISSQLAWLGENSAGSAD